LNKSRRKDFPGRGGNDSSADKAQSSGNHAHADTPARINTFPHGDDFADQLMAKDGRRLNHFGVNSRASRL